MKTTPILALPYPESTDSADVPRDIKALAEKLDPAAPASGLFIIGEVRFVAVAATPTGWLPCDGAAVSRTTYAALFAAIAAVFGPGDGSTTFNVPDCRGRAIAGAGQGTGLAMRTAGTKWGVEAVVLSVTQIPSHNHNGATGVESSDHTHGSGNGYPFMTSTLSVGLNGDPGAAQTWLPNNWTGATSGRSSAHTHAIPAQGGGTGHDNTQPSIAIPAYIYAGV